MIGAQQIASKSQGIDAEAVAFIMASAHEPHPPLTEKKVVRLARNGIDRRMSHPLGLAQGQIGLVEGLCRRA